MSRRRTNSRAGFTVAELIISTALAGTILAAVISSYLFLGRQFTRLMNQQTLESQARRTLLYLAQDTRLATTLTGADPSNTTPTNASVKLIQTTATGTRNIYYYYNSGTSAANVTLGSTSYSMPAKTLSRVDNNTSTRITLVANLLTCYFRYYDDYGNPFDNNTSPYTTVTTYSGMSQVSLIFTSQTGVAKDGTRTPVYQGASNRLLIRNRPMLY